MAEFDAYIVVDWSSNSAPKTGEDSIWYYRVKRASSQVGHDEPQNPRTRHQASEEIAEILRDHERHGIATLVGFDFPYGYSAGFAAALGLPPRDQAHGVAGNVRPDIFEDQRRRSQSKQPLGSGCGAEPASFRQTISVLGMSRQQGRAVPFGYATGFAAFLTPRKLHPYPPDGLQEFRLTDKRAKGAQSAWKLCFAGSVGGQALTGIPVVARLRADPQLVAISVVWPFETGLRQLPQRRERSWLILHAEIFPPLIKAKPNHGEVKDRAQVRELALYFARADEKAELNEMFAGPTDLSEEQRRSVEAEEGWILGVKS